LGDEHQNIFMGKQITRETMSSK